jgi:hypothetical protein
MAIDPATLYKTGFPSIGDEYTFRDGLRGVIENVFIRRQNLDRQQSPRVIVQFYDRHGGRADRSESSIEDIQSWCTAHGARKTKNGKYEVVSPHVVP